VVYVYVNYLLYEVISVVVLAFGNIWKELEKTYNNTVYEKSI